MSGNEDGDFKPTWSFAGLGAATAASTTSRRSSRKPTGARGGRSSPTPSVAPSQRTMAPKATNRISQPSSTAALSSASASTHRPRTQPREDDDDKTITSRRRPADRVGSTRECAVCTEELADSEFPTKHITSACNHAINTCKTCLKTSIRSDMNNKFWNRISCPECGASLIQEDVERHAEPATVEKYRKLKENADRQASPNFRWCAAGCGAGQEHTGGPNQPMMICQGCNARSCFNHECRWHEGFTCRQWDKVTEPDDDESVASTRKPPTLARSEASPRRGLSSAASEVSSRQSVPVAASKASKRCDKSSVISVSPSLAASTASSQRPPSVASSRASVRSATSALTRSTVSGTSNLSRATSPTASQSSSRTIRPAPSSAASSVSHLHVSRRAQSSSRTSMQGDVSDRQLSERRLISIREEEEATNIKFSMELARRLQLDEDRATAKFYEGESLKAARQLAAEFAAEEVASREQLSLGLARRMQEEWAAMDEEEREKSSASMARRLQEAENASLVNTDFMIAQRLHQEEEARARSGGEQWDPELRGGGVSLSRPRSPKSRRRSRGHGRDHEYRHRSSHSDRHHERLHHHRRPSLADDDRRYREREDVHETRRTYEEQKQKEERERGSRKEEQLAAQRRQDKEKEEREEAARKQEALMEQKRRELATAAAKQVREQQAAAAELKSRREAARAERARMAAERGIPQSAAGAGQTFVQGDAIQEAKMRRKQERASEAAIKLLSKPCPECKFDTFKAEGW
ncbi:uncharacterized protein PgNI_00771 [Pyricularia grisea]|uniref:RING-type domain-containing protein n=1 Tax=Pyricularia grisea TaxID=148305 RepID=A0A6P8BJQ6_PYRGI|nr:uncharacterized protein PgNI_00771 [Pyricularia grisea]TLD16812.1 hypothetical protein PgNI_00771 [Pyricularia grisea]